MSAWWHAWLPGGRESQWASARWVVVDTETTGLDPARDALIAIGGVAVVDAGVVPADSFEAIVYRDGNVDQENVVIHGLGHEAQRAGAPLPDVLAAFRAWVGDACLVGYHARFDRAVLSMAARRAGIDWPDRRWLDLAPLAAALGRSGAPGEGTLDDCLAANGIACSARHHAAGDALATAELMVKLRARAARRGAVGFAALLDLTSERRWLPTG